LSDAGGDEGGCQDDAAAVGQGVLVVAGGDSAPLLEAVVAAFDGVAVLVDLGVEGRWPATGAAFGLAACDLVAAFGDGVPDPPGPQQLAGGRV
jgi:hypothetical protein